MGVEHRRDTATLPCLQRLAARNPHGQCRSCRRQLPVNRSNICRLCLAARRHPDGDTDEATSTSFPGERSIQLFFGDMELGHPRARARATTSESTAGAIGDGVDMASPAQLRLFDPVPEPSRAGAAAKHWARTETGQKMHAELAAFAQARGWWPATTQRTSHALALLVAVGGLEADPPVISAELAAQLRRRHLPVTRLVQFLTHITGEPVTGPGRDKQVASDRPPRCLLPAPMRRELQLWAEVLWGNTRRSRPHTETTIDNYRRAVAPAIGSWAQEYTSLREVTTGDLTRWVQPLTGSARVGAIVALRSLFAALKSQRVIFTDPARGVHPGRFPRRPVLGLDPAARGGLLTQANRADHQLVMLLAGVHALTRANIAGLLLTDLDLARRRLNIHRRPIILEDLTHRHLCRWLEVRRGRWPMTANPHLLVTGKSAHDLAPVSSQYFRGLPIPISRLRADRLLSAAADNNGDPLMLQQLFDIDPDTAIRYCNELLPTEQPPRPTDPGLTSPGRDLEGGQP